MQVDIQIACRDEEVPSARELREWARAATVSSPGVELTVRVVGEPEARGLNQRYRHQTGATNVLSFPFEPPPGVSMGLLGDVVICAPVVEREAREGAMTSRAHWAHMVVHGVLHLLGHDHQHDAQAHRMQAEESKLLVGMGFDDPHAREARR